MGGEATAWVGPGRGMRRTWDGGRNALRALLRRCYAERDAARPRLAANPGQDRDFRPASGLARRLLLLLPEHDEDEDVLSGPKRDQVRKEHNHEALSQDDDGGGDDGRLARGDGLLDRERSGDRGRGPRGD